MLQSIVIDYLSPHLCTVYLCTVYIRLVAIKSTFYRIKPIPPLIFREHSLQALVKKFSGIILEMTNHYFQY